MPRHFTGDKSTLVQVMAWCRQATRHYLNQCWYRFMSPYGVTGSQRVKYSLGSGPCVCISLCDQWAVYTFKDSRDLSHITNGNKNIQPVEYNFIYRALKKVSYMSKNITHNFENRYKTLEMRHYIWKKCSPTKLMVLLCIVMKFAILSICVCYGDNECLCYASFKV